MVPMAYNEKIDNLLNLSMNSTPEEFVRSQVLNVGFDERQKVWEVVVKYAGSLATLRQKFPQIQSQELLFQYAILQIPENLVDAVASDVQIAYMEKPRSLLFTACFGSVPSCGGKQSEMESKEVICSQIPDEGLSGRGTIIAIVDSGIDYAHPDFRNEDGTTRILLLWDQPLGRVFDSAQINQALRAPSSQERYQLVPSRDLSGHGTHVAGIAAGNGRASDGRYVGVAPEANLIVVRLGTQREGAFPRTTELMSAVDFSLRQAYTLQMPVVINLSFGNNYGGHDGTSLLETYLDNAASYWKSLIVAGTGNEGDGGIHTEGSFRKGNVINGVVTDGEISNESVTVEFSVGDYDTGFNIQIWKNFADEMQFSIVAPSGETIGTLQSELGTQRFLTTGTDVLVYYGMPSPYSVSQEIFLDFIPKDNYVDQGVWNIVITPVKIVEGNYNLWLPSQGAIGGGTAFLRPTEGTTLTIPSTASKILSVGAYDARFLTMAAFSGRGYTRVNNNVKPDVVAPGVEIVSAAPGGGYAIRSGTSMAAPYASGLAALMMEYGIVNKNDPFLFGSKIIAYMQREARPLPGFSDYPNPVTGWGRIG